MVRANALAPRLIGRDVQLQSLDAYLQLARGGTGQVVLISGEAGVGKTRLLRAFVERALKQDDAAIVQGHCYDEDPAVPYGPFIDALLALAATRGTESLLQAAGPWSVDLGLLLPELAPAAAPTADPGDPQVQKRRIFAAIHRVVQPPAGKSCCLVVLEDVHWADQTSLELLRYLARAISRDPILLIGTYRSDELHRRHPLTHVLAALTRERLFQEVRVGPLSHEELAIMLEAALERKLPSRFVATMYDRTGGNPFFAEELLTALLEHDDVGALIQDSQQSRRAGCPAVPESLKESILRRTADLGDATAEVLAYGAVIGRSFRFELLLRLTGLGETALLNAIDELVSRRLVVEDRSGSALDRYTFRHALTREAVYDDMLGRERRLRHRAVLQALEDLHAGGLDPVIDQLAYHSVQARETKKAIRYSLIAAERSVQVNAYPEAVAHYEVALDLLEDDDPRARAELCDRLGEAAFPLADTTRCLRYWQEARRLYAEAGDPLKVGDVFRRLGVAALERGDMEKAFSHTRAALDVLEALPPGRELAMAYSSLSRLYMLRQQLADTREWGEKALRLAEELGDDSVLSHALNNIGTAFGDAGQPERGIEYLERSLEIARRAGLPGDALRGYNNLSQTLYKIGAYSRGAAVLRDGIAFARSVGWELHGYLTIANLASAEMALGHWSQAQQQLDQVIRATELDHPRDRMVAQFLKSELLARQGRTDEAVDVWAELLAEVERRDEIQWLGGMWHLAAIIRLQQADVAAAVAAMDRSVELWQTPGPRLGNEEMLCTAVQVYLAAGKPEQAAEHLMSLSALAACTQTPPVHAFHEIALGLSAAAAGEHASAAAHFDRAAGLWRSIEVPYQEARSRRRRAESLLAEGTESSRDVAAMELVAARETFANLGAMIELEAVDATARRHSLAPRPTRAARRPTDLTRREREVIALIAQGCSNREISQRLVITEKTAEVHVGNILGKLGFTSRAQAAAYAVAHGLASAPGA